MTKIIKLDDLGAYYEDTVTSLLRGTILELGAQIKKESPVDSGRFRMSWQIGQNSTQAGVLPPAPKAFYALKKGSRTPFYKDQGDGRMKTVGYRAGYENIGNSYYIHNNLPYAEALSYGTSLPPSWKKAGIMGSSQARVGWLDLVAKEQLRKTKSRLAHIQRRS